MRDYNSKTFIFDIDGTLNVLENNPMSEIYKPGYFENAKPFRQIIRRLRKLDDMNIDIMIMSEVINYEAGREKLRWLKKNKIFVDHNRIYFPKWKYDTKLGMLSECIMIEHDLQKEDIILVDDNLHLLKQFREEGYEGWHISKFLNEMDRDEV